MKRSIFSLGLMLSALFTLTNCAKELDAPASTPEQEGIPFEITAPMEDATKTSNDGLATRWVTGDEMNVFYAEAGTTAYSDNRKFSIAEADIASGLFKGSLNEQKPLAASNDWYALYPFDNHMHSPVNTYKNGAYLVIGSKASSAQSQEGAGNMRHIAGADYPLYGVAEGVPQGNVPTFSMKQVAALLKVAVKNNTGEELPVSSVKFTAPVDIVGTFYIDFSKEPLSFAGSGKDFVSRTAALTVRNASVPAGGTGEFYLAFKPFKAEAQDLTVEVNGYAKTIKAATTDFAAGKIKTLNFNYDQKPAIYSTSFDYRIDGNSYNSDKEIVGTDAGTTTSWGIVYGNWNGSDCAQMRTYSGDKVGEKGSLYMKFDISHVQTVSYKARVKNEGNLSLNTYYSIDGGQVWVPVDVKKVLTKELAPYSFEIPGDFEKVRIKFVTNIDKQAKDELTIDDVKIFGTGEVLVAKELAIPSNVQTSVNDKSVTVTWKDVLNATEYVVTCGSKTVKVLPGIQTATLTMEDYGRYSVSVKATAPGYTSSTANVEVALLDPTIKSNFVKVTSASQIVPGGKYYLATPSGAIFNGSISKGHLGTVAGANNVDGMYSDIPVSSVMLTLVADGNDYKLKYVDEDKYITATKAGSGGFKLVTLDDTPISWTVTFGTSVKIRSAVGFGNNSEEHCEFRVYDNSSFRSYKDPSSNGESPVLIQVVE